MAVHPQRSTWTDERLDDLSRSVRDGFERVDADIRELRGETREGFARSDQRFDQLEQRFEQRFDRLASRLDSLQLTLIVGMTGLIGTIIASALLG